MGKTSNAVKDRWNKAHYKQYTARIKPDIYDEIEKYIADNGLSKPKFLELAIRELNRIDV